MLKRSEDTEQIAIINWAFYQQKKHPELKWLYHCPNGGSRNAREAVKLKNMGVKAGVSDLHLPYPKGKYCGLFIELKYGNNKPTDHQKEFIADMAAAGHYTIICYGADAAIGILQEYLNLTEGAEMEKENGSTIKHQSVRF